MAPPHGDNRKDAFGIQQVNLLGNLGLGGWSGSCNRLTLEETCHFLLLLFQLLSFFCFCQLLLLLSLQSFLFLFLTLFLLFFQAFCFLGIGTGNFLQLLLLGRQTVEDVVTVGFNLVSVLLGKGVGKGILCLGLLLGSFGRCDTWVVGETLGELHARYEFLRQSCRHLLDLLHGSIVVLESDGFVKLLHHVDGTSEEVLEHLFKVVLHALEDAVECIPVLLLEHCLALCFLLRLQLLGCILVAIYLQLVRDGALLVWVNLVLNLSELCTHLVKELGERAAAVVHLLQGLACLVDEQCYLLIQFVVVQSSLLLHCL